MSARGGFGWGLARIEGNSVACQASQDACQTTGLRVPGRLPVSREEQACPVPASAGAWHPPSDHDHGDAPPEWASVWSCATFGWPVIFGGDEQTPDENLNKHRAFKGYAWTAVSDAGQPVELYLRLHMQTNPLGRRGQFHSYELYAAMANESGDLAVVGFWQGWLDFGASPDHRDSFNDDYLWQIVPGYSPANHITGYDVVDNRYYDEGYSGREFWYAQRSTPGGWDPVIIVDIYDPTTFYSASESEYAANPASWKPTGGKGLDRRVTLRWIAGGSTVRTVSGRPYRTRNLRDPRGWFCATPRGKIVSTGTVDCAAGSIPQYISPDMQTIAAVRGEGSKYGKTWICDACVLPN